MLREKYGYKADIWSLGILLFTMLNRNNPFQALSREDYHKNIQSGVYNFRKSTLEKMSL